MGKEQKNPIVRKLENAWWVLLNHTLPDKMLLSIRYKHFFHKKLNWEKPLTFSEKIQWLKLYGRTPINVIMSDKYAVKEYVSERIGEKYVIPLLGVWDRPEEIDFSQLPDQFVIKCNHNSGGVFVCQDKSKFNEEMVRRGLRKAMKHDYYIDSREYAYKGIPRKIFAEQYMEDTETHELRDYKFFCFDGVPKALFIATGRLQGEDKVKFDFFDMDYNHLPFTNGHPNAKILPEKPKCFEEMKQLAAKLSKGMPHVRIDFYEVNGKVYFGEFTFSHWGGLKPFEPEKWDYTFGSWIKLPERKVLHPGIQPD